MERYLPLKEAQDRFREMGVELSLHTLRKLIKQGMLVGFKPGRAYYVEEKSLTDYIRGNAPLRS